MGYVVVSNIYPSEVEERNNSQSKVISQILVLGTQSFYDSLKRNHIVQFYSSFSTLNHSKCKAILTRAKDICPSCFILHLLGLYGAW